MTLEEAKKLMKKYKKEWPNLKFKLDSYNNGNKLGWQVVQLNRFKD